MKKNIIKSLLSLILSVSMLVTGLGLTVHADPGEVPEVLDDTYLKILGIGEKIPYQGWDQNLTSYFEIRYPAGHANAGDEIPYESIDGNRVYRDVPENSEFYLDFGFYLETGESSNQFKYGEKHSFDIDLPTEFFFDSAGPENVDMGKGASFTWEVVDGKIKVTLSNLDKLSDRRLGLVGLSGRVSNLESSGDNPAEFDIGSNSIVIWGEELPPVVDDHTLNKSVEWNAETEVLTWTITVTHSKTENVSTTQLPLDGYKIIDKLSDNHDYIENSFALTPDGIINNSSFEYNYSTRVLEYTIPDGSMSPLTFTYQTKPNTYGDEGVDGESSSTIFSNGAELWDAHQKVASDSKEHSVDWIEKVAKAEQQADGTYRIEWTVKLNVPVDKTITDVVIKDIIGAGHDYDSATGVVSTPPLTDGHTIVYAEKTLTITIPELTGPTVLTYYTKVNKDFLNNNVAIDFTNDATLTWDGMVDPNNGPSASDGVGIIGSGGLINKSADYGSIEYEPGREYIQWTVVVNKSRYPMENVKIRDIIPTGQVFVVDQDHPFEVTSTDTSFTPVLIIDVSNDSRLTVDTFGSAEDSDYGYGFEYVLSEEQTEHQYTVTFFTKIDPLTPLYTNSSASFTNKVFLYRAGKETVSAGATTTRTNKMIQKNNVTDYDYVNRDVEWEIIVNQGRLPLTNAVVRDVLPKGFIGDTTIFEGSTEKKAITIKLEKATSDVLATPYAWEQVGTLSVIELILIGSGEQEGRYQFSYQLTSDSGEYGETYRLTFKTKITDEALLEQWKGNKGFRNDAYLSSSNFDDEINANKSVNIKNPFIEKSAALWQVGDTSIDWKVEINKGLVNLSGAKVSDLLKPYLSLDKDTVELFQAPVTSSGTLDLINKVKIDIIWEGDSSNASLESMGEDGNLFTLNLDDGPLAYYLTFTTDIVTPDRRINIENTINLTGNNGDVDNSGVADHVNITNLWSFGSGADYGFSITKTSDDGELLNGAKFELLNEFGGGVYRGNNQVYAITGNAAIDANVGDETAVAEDGVAKFRRIPGWYFKVKEVIPPEGYLLPEDESSRIFDIGKPPFSENNIQKTITVTNELALGIFELTKIDAGSEEPISGVGFTLTGEAFDGDSILREGLTTDGDGVLRIEDLPLGTYVLTETGPKPGYLQPERSIEFEVVYNDDYTKAIIEINSSIPEEIEINEDGQIVFENTYEPEPAYLMIPVQKRIIGHPTPSNKTFSFTLIGDESAPMPEEVAGSDQGANVLEIVGAGIASFGEITFEEVGVYQYTIEETEGSDPGYGYDKAKRTVYVNVWDNRDEGRLVADWTVDEEATAVTFTNVYAPGSATIAFPIEKVIETDYEISEKKLFKFELAADGYAPMPEGAVDGKITATITGEGKSAFPLIIFSSAGSYKYKVSEIKGNDDGYTYSSLVYDITVSVWDTGGSLAASWQVQGVEAGTAVDVLSFTNLYKPEGVDFQLSVTKVVEGSKPQSDALFSFSIKALEAGSPLPTSLTTTIKGAGDGAFGNIRYTEPGVYKYRVSEEDGKLSGYTYDKTIYDLTVTVKDVDGKLVASYIVEENGKAVDKIAFTNNFSEEDTGSQIPTEPGDESKPGIPQTGEGRSTSALGLALIVAGLAFGLLSWRQRPRKRFSGQE